MRSKYRTGFQNDLELPALLRKYRLYLAVLPSAAGLNQQTQLSISSPFPQVGLRPFITMMGHLWTKAL